MKPGDNLGVYRVLEKLGEGGMGEVYRARDTKLDRDVAIKVLPELFASDPDRLSALRTRSPARLAALQPPEHRAGLRRHRAAAGIAALVMELVEGEDLAERIAHGPLSRSMKRF